MTQAGHGDKLATRPLHFIWIVDCSSSMGGDKIKSLNFAIREALLAMKIVVDKYPHAKMVVRAVKFSDGAQWHIARPTPIENFKWVDLIADEGTDTTDMGKAMELVAEKLKMPPMEARALPPVLVLVTDGYPTDDFSSGLNQLISLPWGKKAVRLGIAIGRDAHLEVLEKFIVNPEIKPLQANNSDTLVKYIRWASSLICAPPSDPFSSRTSFVPVPIPSPPSTAENDDW